MVFIRPTILRDGMAADGVSQRKYNDMREQIYRDEQGLSLMPHTAQPVLPAQNQALPPEVRAFPMPGERVNGAVAQETTANTVRLP